jgi:putative sigma-54 modulation protein
MKTQVTFRHVKSNQILHDAANEEAQRFGKFSDAITSADIIFTDDNGKVVDITVRVNGSTLVGKEISDDFSKSLNEASDKIIRQLRKWKTKHNQV